MPVTAQITIVCAVPVTVGWYARLTKTKPCNQKIGEKQREANSWFCGRGPVLRGGRSHLGPIRPGRRREALHPQLRRGRRRRHLALVARCQRRQVDGLRRQLLPD